MDLLVKEVVEQRNIKFIWHFTKFSNFQNIISYGLIPRSDLKNYNILSEFNDLHRYDNHVNANCVSVGFPNYKMFYKYRMQDTKVKWIVLVIKAEILWLKDCAFYFTNAASNKVRFTQTEELKGVQAFQAMFNEIIGKNRDQANLPIGFPTDPQAEVLVFDEIEPKYIVGGVFNDEAQLSEAKIRFPKFLFMCNDFLYRPRKDYLQWQLRNG